MSRSALDFRGLNRSAARRHASSRRPHGRQNVRSCGKGASQRPTAPCVQMREPIARPSNRNARAPLQVRRIGRRLGGMFWRFDIGVLVNPVNRSSRPDLIRAPRRRRLRLAEQAGITGITGTPYQIPICDKLTPERRSHRARHCLPPDSPRRRPHGGQNFRLRKKTLPRGRWRSLPNGARQKSEMTGPSR